MMIKNEVLEKAKICVTGLIDNNLKVIITESCTAGLMSFVISCIPGASKVLSCSFVVYSNYAKSKILGINMDMIDKYGAVSPEVSLLMATCALKASEADISISITGFAGPSNNICEKVGLVYIGYAISELESEYKKCYFQNMNRYEIQMSSVDFALDFLLYKIRQLK
ncbi:CinA family protein [Ehrlichia ruminantium]|uniref:CinA C-terminal domain-containing protein n=1 Tax=Ehrlichia ruminantium (strain Welgevonden) TaxID=254945 RepID=A0A0H3M0G5_EHRRW|nr:CinA family protein [Ehrlichia ruminantium]QLK50976.1 CinA family protein [Ehrlichia ruminantium]QLK51898.1 CinA family protein [Ehrlichia ruminantium]QLK53739.1 CinA family protein [Ehrlichia ruminantium]QLK55575.1 CinA family protein [Ehrlichia ruminantium]QLK56491.1 CinA family protein [Ehrlichia ruminantium]